MTTPEDEARREVEAWRERWGGLTVLNYDTVLDLISRLTPIMAARNYSARERVVQSERADRAEAIIDAVRTAKQGACVTLPDGDCVGRGCMHDPLVARAREADLANATLMGMHGEHAALACEGVKAVQPVIADLRAKLTAAETERDEARAGWSELTLKVIATGARDMRCRELTAERDALQARLGKAAKEMRCALQMPYFAVPLKDAVQRFLAALDAEAKEG
jgi:hypothetical protein